MPMQPTTMRSDGAVVPSLPSAEAGTTYGPATAAAAADKNLRLDMVLLIMCSLPDSVRAPRNPSTRRGRVIGAACRCRYDRTPPSSVQVRPRRRLAQRFPHAPREIREGEGFLDELHVTFQDAMMRDGIRRI